MSLCLYAGIAVFVAALGLFAAGEAGIGGGRIGGMGAAAVTGGVGALGVGAAFCKSLLVLLVIGGVGV